MRQEAAVAIIKIAVIRIVAIKNNPVPVIVAHKIAQRKRIPNVPGITVPKT